MNLHNHFLIAMPALQDPIFHRSVVYICEYNKNGAIGIIINKPIENLKIKNILTKLKIELNSDLSVYLDHAVMLGGPIAEDRGFILLHTPPVLLSNIYISSAITTSDDQNKNIFKTIKTDGTLSGLLIALGYASWEKGQLEQEIIDNFWLVAPADINILFKTPIANRWRDAAKLIGVDIYTITGFMGHA